MKQETYLGHKITYKCGYYWALGTLCKTIGQAKKLIEQFYE
jgi:hypothetical protein